jgi:hypothetical protein
MSEIRMAFIEAHTSHTLLGPNAEVMRHEG